MRRTKIVCTLGPSTDKEEVLSKTGYDKETPGRAESASGSTS